MSSASVRQSGAPQTPQSLRGSLAKIFSRRLAFWMALVGSASRGQDSTGDDGMVERQEILVVEPADVLGVDDRLFPGGGDELQDAALGQETVLHFERPAHATVRADRALEQVDILEEAGLDLVEDPHGVPDARRRRRPGGCLSPRVSPPERDQPMPMPLNCVSGKR